MSSFAFIATPVSLACSSRPSVESSDSVPRYDPEVATINVRPGEDSQAKILSLDGVPFDSFVSRYARPGHFRIPIHPGPHEVRVVVPGLCTYYDGRPGPGSSLSTMRFIAKAGATYEVGLQSFPSQILSVTMVHVFELLESPNHLRIVEETTSTEPEPSSCARR